jgi:hypothetical protein
LRRLPGSGRTDSMRGARPEAFAAVPGVGRAQAADRRRSVGRRRLITFTRLASLAALCSLALPACSSAPPPQTETPKWETRDSAGNVPREWRTCRQPSDCVLVQTTCCDQCNGGAVVAVTHAHEGDAKALKPECGQQACTLRACSTRAGCEYGECVVQWLSGG